jgi:hypothetical protein
MVDDDCPHCGARHSSPVKSDDLTDIIVPDEGTFIVMRSLKVAERTPRYSEVARFPTAELAAKFVEDSTD